MPSLNETINSFSNTEYTNWNDASYQASKEIFVLSEQITSSINDIRDWFEDMSTNFFNKPGSSAAEDWLFLGAKALTWGLSAGHSVSHEELSSTLVKKQRDYGHHNIAKFGRDGLLIRVHDKIARLENLAASSLAASNEPIKDTVLDIAGYSAIGIMWDKEQFLLDLI